MRQLSKIDVCPSRRNALILGIIVMLFVTAVRQVSVTPGEVERRQAFSELTGLDIDDLPHWFASGAGGDGEVFLVMASDPLARDIPSLIRQPGYRYSMVGYSWLSWILAFGRERLTPVAMAAIGLLSVGAMAYMAMRFRDRLGSRSWLLLLNPALLLGFFGDSSEPLAILLLTLAIVTSTPWSAAALAAVRPPYLTGLADAPKKFFVGISVAVVIRLLAAWRFDGSFFDGSNNLGLPFRGFMAVPTFLGLTVIGAGVVTLILGVRGRSFSWMVSGLLVIMMSSVVYDTPLNAVRGAGMLPVLWAFGREPLTTSSRIETPDRVPGDVISPEPIPQSDPGSCRSS